MKLKYLVLPGLLLGAALAFSAASTFAQSAPSPTSGTKLTGGLLSPRGMKIGPDGMLYVAEAGTGGDIAAPTADGGKSGFTGRISKIDLATGARTTVADKLPSNGGGEGDNVGPADVAFVNGDLYYVQTHGGEFYGFPDNPSGVYKVNNDGTVKLVANTGAYNIAHPIDDIASGKQPDIEVGGNPYAMIVRDGKFLVTDGNQNQVMQITTSGDITRLAEFHGHPVETGIASVASGPLYVTTLGQFPFSPDDGAVYQIAYPTGTITKVASGFSSMTDVEVGPGGQLYALSFGDQNPGGGPNDPPWMFGSGKVFKVDATTGMLTPIVTGFSFTTGLIFSGDTAYVANNGVTIPGLNDGEIWKIEKVSTLAALAVPEPTKVVAPPTPAPPSKPGGISAPDTGSGPTGGSGIEFWMLAIGAAALGAASVAGGYAAKRR